MLTFLTQTYPKKCEWQKYVFWTQFQEFLNRMVYVWYNSLLIDSSTVFMACTLFCWLFQLNPIPWRPYIQNLRSDLMHIFIRVQVARSLFWISNELQSLQHLLNKQKLNMAMLILLGIRERLPFTPWILGELFGHQRVGVKSDSRLFSPFSCLKIHLEGEVLRRSLYSAAYLKV